MSLSHMCDLQIATRRGTSVACDNPTADDVSRDHCYTPFSKELCTAEQNPLLCHFFRIQYCNWVL